MRVLPVFIPHAGCTHTCVFCNQTSTSASSSIPTPAEVVASVNSALKSGPLDEIAYYGGSFTALPQEQLRRYLDCLQPFVESGRIGGIRVSTRPDAVDEKVVALMKASAVTTVELGCQSFDDAVLRVSGRGLVSADAAKAVLMLQREGFRLGVQLMPGLPGARRGEALFSVAQAFSLRPDFLRIYPTVVLEGTRLARDWREGTYEPLSLDEAVDICAEIDLFCRERALPVIRYGLQANDLLSSGSILAGPYHPAFGQLVRSRVWRRGLEKLMRVSADSVEVHPHDLSDAIGHKRENMQYFQTFEDPFEIKTNPRLRTGFIGAGGGIYQLNTLLRAEKAGQS